MKITVEGLPTGTEVFDEVSDAYLCVRQLQPMGSTEKGLSFLHGVHSHSWGGNVREMVKELRQSTLELEDWLKQRRGSG
jgi:hypothetical protein